MEQKILVDKIISFCYEYGVINKSFPLSKFESMIERNLDKTDFVESLINKIILTTKIRQGVDIKLVKELLIELEKIRLELEYKSPTV